MSGRGGARDTMVLAQTALDDDVHHGVVLVGLLELGGGDPDLVRAGARLARLVEDLVHTHGTRGAP